MEKCAWKDSTYTLNRDIVWAKAEYALELALNFKSNGSRRICAIFFNRQFMIIATMSAKGYGIFLGMVAALISWFTSPLLVLLLFLFLVPARKGVSGTLIK
jgi:hypothetical protein